MTINRTWIYTKLKDITSPITRIVGSAEVIPLSISAKNGFIPQIEKFGRDISGKQYEKYILLKKGEFAYNKGNSLTYPQGCVYRLEKYSKAAVPNVFECFEINDTNVSSEFIQYYFRANLHGKYLYKLVNSGVRNNGLLNLSSEDFYNLPIPCPPIEEQRRIVEVLECWDKGIELVKKLIEQKELQKKYLMQQLLSGVLRLKGFTQKWGKKPLGKLITLYQGYPFKSETYSAQGHYKIITIANVKQGYLDLAKFSTIQVLPPDILNYQQLDVGDILISMTGNVGRVCLVNSKNCLLNQRVGKIEANLLNKEFLFYILQLPDFLNVMLACAQGGAQANLSTKDIYHYVLFYPSDAREQQAIAEVLSSADKEIDLLKQKLAKLEAQKKGLMQVLLTGKIRLK